MKVVTTDRNEQHNPQFFLVRGQLGRSAEQPERAKILKAAALNAGLEQIDAKIHDRSEIKTIHTEDYLNFLETASAEWREFAGASPEVIANIHPNRVAAHYPRGIVGRAGWHMADTACPIGPHTFKAALASADVALTASNLLLDGEDKVYALCRPPGHHAYSDMAGGFCFLNNSAIAAQALLSRNERVAILDIDVHHGNGTQEIFYRRGDVLTLSVHTDPDQYYPYFWGYSQEIGEGHGKGMNFNFPLPPNCQDEVWLNAISQALKHIDHYSPGSLVIALGLDAHESDPLQGMRISHSGFHAAGQKIASMNLPTLLVQEGGYLSPHLGRSLSAFLSGFLKLQ